jgi:hypothetical protein
MDSARGRSIIRLVPVAAATMLLIQILAGRAEGVVGEQRGWRWPPAHGEARARILAQLG